MRATVIAMMALSAPSMVSAEPESTPVVLELFTSQGCSSCPSADALFESYAGRSDVIALSFSVHYWDSLGWKDTLASPRFTDRQKAYARARGDGQVYTPQIVVNGQTHTVGSDKAAIDASLRQGHKREAWLPLKLTRAADGTRLEAPGHETWKGDTLLWLATITRRVEVAVKRGENAGHTLSYFNAVRSLDQIGHYSGQPVSLVLDQRALDQSETDLIVVLAQSGTSGPIVGAAKLAMKP